MTHVINIFLNIFLILIICYQIPQETVEFMSTKKEIQKQNSFLNFINFLIIFLILAIFGIIIFLNKTKFIDKY